MEAGLCHMAECRILVLVTAGYLQQQHSRTMQACRLMPLRNVPKLASRLRAGHAHGEVDDY
jgi:hypothetical protein